MPIHSGRSITLPSVPPYSPTKLFLIIFYAGCSIVVWGGQLSFFLSCSLEFGCGNKHLLDIVLLFLRLIFLTPVLLSALGGMQNSEMQHPESNIPWGLEEHIFGSGLSSGVFSTKQMLEAVWEPPRFYTERDFLTVTEALRWPSGVVFPKKSVPLTGTSSTGLLFSLTPDSKSLGYNDIN